MTDLVTDLRDLARHFRDGGDSITADLIQRAAHVIMTKDEKRPVGRPTRLDPGTLELIRQYREVGMSLTQVAARLTAEGVPSASGKPWHPSSVGYWARKLRSSVPGNE